MHVQRVAVVELLVEEEAVVGGHNLFRRRHRRLTPYWAGLEAVDSDSFVCASSSSNCKHCSSAGDGVHPP